MNELKVPPELIDFRKELENGAKTDFKFNGDDLFKLVCIKCDSEDCFVVYKEGGRFYMIGIVCKSCGNILTELQMYPE